MSLLSFKSKMFLPLHSIFFFSHIILGTSLHNLECASGFCCDICKASGAGLLGTRGGGGALPYVDLPALFIRVSVLFCFVLFVFCLA